MQKKHFYKEKEMAKAIAARTLKMMDFIRKHPNMPAPQIAHKFNIHVTRIYQLKRRIKAEEVTAEANKALNGLQWSVSATDDGDIVARMDPTPGPTPEHEADARASSAIRDAKRTPEEAAARVEKYFPAKVDAILDERAENYGKFIDGAEVMQMLKRLVHGYIEQRGTQLAFDQREAIDMIVHKLGRIINGNPDHVDSWRDIAGYATLVADRLEGNAR